MRPFNAALAMNDSRSGPKDDNGRNTDGDQEDDHPDQVTPWPGHCISGLRPTARRGSSFDDDHVDPVHRFVGYLVAEGSDVDAIAAHPDLGQVGPNREGP